MKLLGFVLMLFTLISVTFAGDRKNQRYELTEMEQVLIEEVAKKPVDKEKLFYLYILTGREAYALNHMGKANIYYKKAIALNYAGDKTEAFINRMAISHQLKEYARLRGEWQRAGQYFSSNPVLLKRNKPFMEYYDSVYELKSKKDLQPYRGLFKWNSTPIVIKQQIKNKKYLKALVAFDPTKIGKSKNWENKVTFDLLNILVKKKKVKKLHCEKGHYSIVDHNSKICAILVSYLKNGKVDGNKMIDLEQYIRKRQRNKRFIVDALKDI